MEMEGSDIGFAMPCLKRQSNRAFISRTTCARDSNAHVNSRSGESTCLGRPPNGELPSPNPFGSYLVYLIGITQLRE